MDDAIERPETRFQCESIAAFWMRPRETRGFTVASRIFGNAELGALKRHPIPCCEIRFPPANGR
jgi:hypothetical protein